MNPPPLRPDNIRPNPAHAVDGGIPVLPDAGCAWPGAYEQVVSCRLDSPRSEHDQTIAASE